MNAGPPLPHDSIADGRDWLREQLREGAHCPLCGQLAKVYKRTLTSSTGRSLLEIYRVAHGDWVHVPSLVHSTGHEEAKARHWGLLQSRGDYREDGAKWSGYWRLTPLGVRFVRRQVKVPRFALLYDGRLLGLEGEPIGIDDVLGTRFRFDDLMNEGDSA